MANGLPGGLVNDGAVAYSWSIEVDGVAIAQAAEASGITAEIDIVELKENTAEGQLVIKKLPGAPKPPTIKLKRAMSTSTDLYDWYAAMAAGDVASGRRNGSLVMLAPDKSPIARFNFLNGFISKLTIGAAKAGSNELISEEVEIVVEGLERV